MSNSVVLTPGQSIKPKINEEKAIALVQELYGLRIKKIRELNGYDDKNYHVLCEDDHTNPYIQNVAEHGYVLKILNSLDSRNTSFVEGQNEMMLFLDKRDINCSVPVQNIHGSFYTVEELQSEPNEGHIVRLLVFRPGSTLYNVPITVELLKDVGRFAARLDLTLAEFSHPSYEDRSTLWMLAAIPKLRDFIYAVENEEDKKMILRIVECFEKRVLSVSDQLEKAIIHGDLNEQNLLVNAEGTRVTGVIDFGDTNKTSTIFELAIAVCYMIIQSRDLKMAKHVIDGFQSIKQLTRLEKDILKICVCSRLCQSLTLGAYSHLSDPQNEYLLITQKPGWDILRKLWPLEENEIFRIWGLENS